MPCSFRERNTPMISSDVLVSSAPVGSSANIILMQNIQKKQRRDLTAYFLLFLARTSEQCADNLTQTHSGKNYRIHDKHKSSAHEGIL